MIEIGDQQLKANQFKFLMRIEIEISEILESKNPSHYFFSKMIKMLNSCSLTHIHTLFIIATESACYLT